MRLRYTKEDLMQPYKRLVDKAWKSYNTGNVNRCIDLIKYAADYQYSVNYVLSDSRLEVLLKKMSERLSKFTYDYKPIENSVIIYDFFTIDNRGLTQQYLDALVVSNRYNVVLVHDTAFHKRSVNTLNYCIEHNVRTIEVGKGDYFERENRLLEIIKEVKPQKVLYHLYPSNVLPLVVFGAFKEIVSYQINLTDHAFWLGSHSIDYSFEYRNIGCCRSEKLRGIRKEKLLLLPFYPWMEVVDFQGFPEQAKDKIVLFAGASLYKIEGGNGVFYNIVKRILDNNPQCIMLFAGDGNRKPLLDFIKSNKYESRLILLGERNDIYEVFKHSDIYLNTYPLFGGLMSQYAALLGKPILTYEKKEVEEVVCTKRKEHFVYESIDDLVNEACKLISDKYYRTQRGEFFRKLSLGQDDFRATFLNSFETNKSQNVIKEEDLNMDFYQIYRNQINEGKFGISLELTALKCGLFIPGWKMWVNILLNPSISTLKIFDKVKKIVKKNKR